MLASERITKGVTTAASDIGLKIEVVQASNSREIEAVFETLARNSADALLVGADPFLSAGASSSQQAARDPALNQGILEPSIGVRKRDPITGGWIDNPAIPGEWVAVSITLPLRKPCLVSPNAVAGRVSLPGPLCVYDKHMTKRERAQRDARI
jgi:hypothetical protein